jgi:selenocysteine lyase/cysteine desulfurase
VIVSERRGVMRIAPHLYNDMSDVERFAMALTSALRT